MWGIKLTRRHPNRSQGKELAPLSVPVVGANKKADVAYIQVWTSENVYTIEMSREYALTLSALLEKAFRESGEHDGWINVQ